MAEKLLPLKVNILCFYPYQLNEEEVLDLISKDEEYEEDDEVMFVREEKNEADSGTDKSKSDKDKSEEKEDKSNEGSLTVTVSKHKKGRSVADTDVVSAMFVIRCFCICVF